MGHLRIRGVVCKLEPEKAFGFIRPYRGGDDLFFSLRDLPEGASSVQLGSEVEFFPLQNEKGPRAGKPVVIRKSPRSPYRTFYVVTTVLTIAFGLGANLYFELPPITAYLAAVSVAAFLLCGYDKSIADGEATRVPELVFYVTSLIGGTAGLILGMKIFRHKTQKQSFQFILGIILIAQLVAMRSLWGIMRESGLM